jgi:hypothetical protein
VALGRSAPSGGGNERIGHGGLFAGIGSLEANRRRRVVRFSSSPPSNSLYFVCLAMWFVL